jgi:hypothetical protein
MGNVYSTKERRRGMLVGYLWGKSGGKKKFGRPRRSSVDNIKSDLRGIGWGGLDWINLARDSNQWRFLVTQK